MVYTGVFITKYHSDLRPQSSRQALPAETEASLRAELIDRIVGAQGEIEAHIAGLHRAGDGAALAAAGNQLQGLSQLQNRIARADGAGLASIRAEVTAFVAAAQVIANQAMASAATTQTAEAALHLASEAARREVTSFVEAFYEKRIFDPFLRFASAEDEEAYREREERRKHDIKEALGLGTPAGTLKANRLSREQMLDAGAHGADASPDYAPMLAQQDASIERLAGAIDRAAAQAPNEVDAALGDVPASSIPTGDPVAVAMRLLTSGVALGEGDGGHGLAAKDVPKATSPARK